MIEGPDLERGIVPKRRGRGKRAMRKGPADRTAGPFEDIADTALRVPTEEGEAQALQACSGLPGEVRVMPAGVPVIV